MATLFGTKTKTQRFNPPIVIRREVACQPAKVDATHLSFPCLEQGINALQPGEIGFVRYTIAPTAGYKPDAMSMVYRSEKGKFFYTHDTETVFSLLLIQQGVSGIDDLPDPMEQNLGTLRFVMDEGEYWQVIDEDCGKTYRWVPVTQAVRDLAKGIRITDNGDGTLTFRNPFRPEGENEITVRLGKPMRSSDGTVQVAENTDNFDLSIQEEITRAAGAEAGLQSGIDRLDSCIDADVEVKTVIVSDEDTVYLSIDSQNLLAGCQSNNTIDFPVASASSAGIMDTTMFNQFWENVNNIAELFDWVQSQGRVVLASLGGTASQTAITLAFNAVYPGTINDKDTVIDLDDTGHEWMHSNGKWINLTVQPLNLATPATDGIVSENNTDGGISYQSAPGKGLVIGWGDLKGRVSAAEGSIAGLQASVGNMNTSLNANYVYGLSFNPATSKLTYSLRNIGSGVASSAEIALPTSPDATATAKGIVQLAGDLGGTAAEPTVVKQNIMALPSNTSNLTTAQFLQWLVDNGMSSSGKYAVAKCTFSYAAYGTITDTGVGTIALAGSVIEVWTADGAVNAAGEHVARVRIHTAPSSDKGGVVSAIFEYFNNGSGYTPAWRRLANSAEVDGKVSKGGDTMTGSLTLGSGTGAQANTVNLNVGGNIYANSTPNGTTPTWTLVMENDDISWRGRIRPTGAGSNSAGFLKVDTAGNTSVDTAAIPSGVYQRANLASTASDNSITASTIGVTGVLPTANGGTGATIVSDMANGATVPQPTPGELVQVTSQGSSNANGALNEKLTKHRLSMVELSYAGLNGTWVNGPDAFESYDKNKLVIDNYSNIQYNRHTGIGIATMVVKTVAAISAGTQVFKIYYKKFNNQKMITTPFFALFGKNGVCYTFWGDKKASDYYVSINNDQAIPNEVHLYGQLVFMFGYNES